MSVQAEEFSKSQKVANLIPGRIKNPGELKDAFKAFNQLSEQLSQSYSVLEDKVVELSGELASLSEQRMAELAEKEVIADQLESLLNIMPAGVIVLDRKGLVVRSNPKADALLNIRAAGQPWKNIIKDCFEPRAGDGHEVSLKSGRLVNVETASLDGSGQLLLLTDLTETRALQTHLARHQRLSAMGKMVASLAHQIRTPLSAAILYNGNLSQPNLDEATKQQFVNKVADRLHQLEQQVRDMLIFVKGDSKMAHRLTVAELILELVSATEVVVNSHQVNLVIENHAATEEIICSKDSLIGALQNLVNNAVEAADNHCEILISTRVNNKNLILSVADNGPGMDKATLAKVAEPFFTSKTHGTGLGLSVVQAVTKAHKGQMNIQSEPGMGCRIELTLPIGISQENL